MFQSSDLTNVGLSLAMVHLRCFSSLFNQSLVCSVLGYLSVSSSRRFPSSCSLSFTFIRTSTVSSRSAVARRPASVRSKALVSSSPAQHLFDRKLNRIRVQGNRFLGLGCSTFQTGIYIFSLQFCISWRGQMIPCTSRTSTLKPSTKLPSVETPSIQAYIHPPPSLKRKPKAIMPIHIYLGQSSDTRTSSFTMRDPLPPSKESRSADVWDSESWLRKQHERNRLRIWMISLCFFVAIGILIALFAWLGSNNWFKHGNK